MHHCDPYTVLAPSPPLRLEEGYDFTIGCRRGESDDGYGTKVNRRKSKFSIPEEDTHNGVNKLFVHGQPTLHAPATPAADHAAPAARQHSATTTPHNFQRVVDCQYA